jgi:hypothetical protein
MAVVRTSDILIKVDGDRIIATLPGTSFSASYFRPPEGDALVQGPGTMNDSASPVPRDQFETRAWEAAKRKARELGWIA